MYLSWERMRQAVRPWVPFTALNTVWRHLDSRSKTLLDVGCGKGAPMLFIKGRRNLWAVGVDTFDPYLKECLLRRSHNALVRGDVRWLPFPPKSFDVVCCLEVLEHMTDEDGLGLIRAIEELARFQVILTTPVGRHEQHEYDGNPFQEHHHIWEPSRLQALGYRVYGHGIRNLGGMSGIQSPLPRFIRPMVDLLWVAAGPLTYFRPEWAGDIVCVKRMG